MFPSPCMHPRWTILHTERSWRWGGQENRVLEECTWMHQQGHRTVIACPANSILAANAIERGLEHVHLSFHRALLPVAALRIHALLRRLRPHILNTHGNLDSKATLPAAIGLRIPCIIRSRHSTTPVRPTYWNRLLHQRLCHLNLCTAECARLQLIQQLNLDPQRVHTVPTGIRVPERLPDRAAAHAALANRLQVGTDTAFVGYVGRLRLNKGLPTLIRAFSLLPPSQPGAQLVLVGDGNQEPELRQLAQNHGVAPRVHWVGFQPDPWDYYRAFDCFVLPTPEFEAISQALRQAMFAGCPVVATHVGGSPEVIRHGETGLLVPAEDPAALADAVGLTLTHPSDAASRAARALEFVRRGHTLEQMGRSLVRLYEGWLSSGAPPATSSMW